MQAFVLVAGDFVQTGGMDVANHALAHYLAHCGHPVHLVAHRVAEPLRSHPGVQFHRVPKPLGSYLLGGPGLDWAGRWWAARVTAQGGRTLVNGGNCRWGDANWVHYVHAAHRREMAASPARRLHAAIAHHRDLATERQALGRARVVVANSKRTRRDLVDRLGIPAERIRVVYYGTDPDRFRPPTSEERAEARVRLGWQPGRPTVAFVGALGDRRKGFDTLFTAWQSLCARSDWDANLAVIGTGAELPRWQARARAVGLADRVHFLGFRDDVPRVLAACDALAAPTRYEAYGLGVQEALCCGLPALVSADAGVAERYPEELEALLIRDPDSPDEVAARLHGWRDHEPALRAATLRLADGLRTHTWDAMAAKVVGVIETAA